MNLYGAIERTRLTHILMAKIQCYQLIIYIYMEMVLDAFIIADLTAKYLTVKHKSK